MPSIHEQIATAEDLTSSSQCLFAAASLKQAAEQGMNDSQFDAAYEKLGAAIKANRDTYIDLLTAAEFAANKTKGYEASGQAWFAFRNLNQSATDAVAIATAVIKACDDADDYMAAALAAYEA